jgi:hypothetical protein
MPVQPRPFLLLSLVVSLLFVLPASDSAARPGGGHSYSSSSSRGSSSSSRGSSSWSSGGRSSSSTFGRCGTSARDENGDGEVDVFEFLLSVLRQLPFLLLIGFIYYLRHRGSIPSWSTASSTAASPPPQENPARRGHRERERLLELRAGIPDGTGGRVVFDPDFSLVPFEDFLYALYARAHEARGTEHLESLSAWLSAGARQALMTLSTAREVRTVVVGAMSYRSATQLLRTSAQMTVTVRFEANYTEVYAAGVERSYYAVEDWTLSRATSVRSRPPDPARVLKCPRCGAPLTEMRTGTCGYCEQRVDTGAFDWVVARITPVSRQARPPQLHGDTPEQGTHLPTVRQPDLEARWHDAQDEDPGLSWNAFEQRLALLFAELQVAWSQREWERVRPYVSDHLFQTQLYWIETYKKQGLRNVSENARITKVELARVESDAYFHAITVRVFAQGLDFTVRDSDGVRVGGSDTRERAYSEYWTLIRGRGVRGVPGSDKRCPSCGAPLSINMAGHCTHCDAHVTSGRFDWVLSRIEQDESYPG